jgi:hypothetical protein
VSWQVLHWNGGGSPGSSVSQTHSGTGSLQNVQTRVSATVLLSLSFRGDDGRVNNDEERAEFDRLREQAAGALRALAFRGVSGETRMSAGAVSARILEIMRLVNEVFRERVPGGLRNCQWTTED